MATTKKKASKKTAKKKATKKKATPKPVEEPVVEEPVAEEPVVEEPAREYEDLPMPRFSRGVNKRKRQVILRDWSTRTGKPLPHNWRRL